MNKLKIKYKKYKVPKIKIDIEKYNHILSTISTQLKQKLDDYFFDKNEWYNKDYNTLIDNLTKVVDTIDKKETAKLIHYFYKQSTDIQNNIKSYDILYQNPNIDNTKMEKVSLRKAILNQYSSFTNDFNEIGVDLNMNELNDDIKITIDKTLFSVIMYNFFDNAKKYIKTSSQIRFKYNYSTNKLDISMYSIKIEKSERDNLFNEGIRGKNANDMTSSGNGIGLSVIKKAFSLMKMNNIHIQCKYDKIDNFENKKFCENHFIFDFNIKN